MHFPEAAASSAPGPVGAPGPRTPPGARASAVFLSLAVVVALTAGWPLVARALPDGQRLAPGRLLHLGAAASERVSLRVTDGGWQLSRAASDPDTGYLLSREGVRLRANRVGLVQPQDAARLWPGLRKVLLTADRTARLGTPRAVRSDSGRPGQTGAAAQGGRSGRAFTFASPERDYGLSVVVLAGAGADPDALRAGYALARTALFAGEGG